MRKLIFRPEQPKTEGVIGWLERKFVGITKDKDTRLERRYQRIHVVAKNYLFKPALWVMKRAMGHYSIDSDKDIPAEPYNNNIRIFYDSWMKALDRNFVEQIYYSKRINGQHKQWVDEDDYLKWLKDTKFWSWDNRRSVINLWTTEILDDTFDREWINTFSCEFYWALHEFYKGDVPKPGTYPRYLNKYSDDPLYFLKFKNVPIWEPKEVKYKK